ncbi:uncharacterized protein HemY [Geomicrobium halophilum]|uniref:Uncharacterized protein HemY n=1 Tax=Geomicrobium halophilum TaxID=549000 RepID=A0A841PXA2_9BACL|nr:hypothetical protein [Geomicrobium halophilum]MBB6448722.1 uncharacterized protein HemY [Geomicrobium halophilum]
MNIGLIVLLLLGAGLIIGITLAIAKNPGDKNYSIESSFKLMSVMYMVVLPIILVIVVIIAAILPFM